MAVYVDDMRAPFRRMIMCHMIADTPDELHAMAARIGMRREWFQGRSRVPHYDVCLQRRAQAVALGAIEVDRAGLCEVLRRMKIPLDGV